MKIGILTYHYSYNFGAMIQAYALLSVVRGFVGEKASVELINYKPASYRNLGEGVANSQFHYIAENRELFLKRFCGIHGDYISDIHQIPEYDCYIVGSDQVWNPNLPVFGETSEYFLDFVPGTKRKIAYAASIGEDINERLNLRLFKENLPRFDYLSVREQSHAEFVERMAGKHCEAVLDPTLLLEDEDYDALLPEKVFEKPYVLCVVYNIRAKGRLYDLANRYSIINDFDIIHFDQYITPYLFRNQEQSLFYSGIGDILWAIKNAQMIITDSFHFLAFSIIYRKPFYVMMSNRNVRMNDLVQYLQLENRILTNRHRPSDLHTAIDYSFAESRLEDKRGRSIQFLKKALGD